MSAGTFEMGLPAAPRPAGPGRRLPRTRASALNLWARVVEVAALAQVAAASAVEAFRPGRFDPTDGRTDPALHAILGALVLALLAVFLVRHAEHRMIGRPPKPLLAFHLSLFLAGSAVATVQVVALERPGLLPRILFFTGHGLLGLATLALAAWFVAAAVTVPVSAGD